MKRTSWLFALLLGLPAGAGESVFPSKERQEMAKLLAPGEVADESRKLLKGKMKHHAHDLRELAMSVATVQLESAAGYANAIANQPRLDKSSAEATKLPPNFFVWQDQLKKSASELAEAAKKKDVPGTQAAFGAVMQTCMACHAAFPVTVEMKGPSDTAKAK